METNYPNLNLDSAAKPAPENVVKKIKDAMLRGYKGLHLPEDLRDRLDRNYEEAFEKHYMKEQELARRAEG